jgi:hypothetical protein
VGEGARLGHHAAGASEGGERAGVPLLRHLLQGARPIDRHRAVPGTYYLYTYISIHLYTYYTHSIYTPNTYTPNTYTHTTPFYAFPGVQQEALHVHWQLLGQGTHQVGGVGGGGRRCGVWGLGVEGVGGGGRGCGEAYSIQHTAQRLLLYALICLYAVMHTHILIYCLLIFFYTVFTLCHTVLASTSSTSWACWMYSTSTTRRYLYTYYLYIY